MGLNSKGFCSFFVVKLESLGVKGKGEIGKLNMIEWINDLLIIKN